MKFDIADFEHALKSYDYDQVLAFDIALDKAFGLNIRESGNDVEEDPYYSGLNPHALLTSYLDYFQILRDIPKDEILIDCGAGYCRGSLLSAYLNLARCVSYEYLELRVIEAKKALNRINSLKQDIFKVDLLTEALPLSYGYYLYFPTGKVLRHILRQVFIHAKNKTIYLYACESHGDLLDYLKLFKSLAIVRRFKASLPRHDKNILKFEVTPLPLKIDFQDNLAEYLLVFENTSKAFVIKLGEYEWIVPITACELIKYNERDALLYQNKRIIEISKNEVIKNIISLTGEQYKKAKEGDKILFKDSCFYLEKNNSFVKINF